jgi:peptidoglycan/LPS O-acetylase OafA/YrhL
MLRQTFLVLHIVSGTAALALGPLALLAAARRHRSRERVLTAYVWAVFATCLTAAVVSVLDWSRLAWLVPVAALSYLLGLVGYLAVRRGWPRWVGAHGLGGSYIALWTALLVVTAGDISTTAEIIAWILPAAVGVPLIVRTHTGARASTH